MTTLHIVIANGDEDHYLEMRCKVLAMTCYVHDFLPSYAYYQLFGKLLFHWIFLWAYISVKMYHRHCKCTTITGSALSAKTTIPEP